MVSRISSHTVKFEFFLVEFSIKSNEDQLENSDRSVLITLVTSTKAKSILFFTLNTQTLFNSRIVNLNILSTNLTMEKIEITFRHINHTNQIPTCVDLKEQNQWNTDVCQLIATNFTHSICSCQHGGTFALLMNLPKVCLNRGRGEDRSTFLNSSQRLNRRKFVYY